MKVNAMDKPTLKIKTLEDAQATLSEYTIGALRKHGPDNCADRTCWRMAAHAIGEHGPYRCETDEAQHQHWTTREITRFYVGDYAPLAARSSLLEVALHGILGFQYIADLNPHHFLHQSTEKPGMVAFTPDAKYGEADRQVRTSFAKYLKRYFGEQLSETQLSDLARLYHTESTPAEFKLLTDPDEIEHAYENGPPSCMRRDRGHLAARAVPHPVQCYGSVPGWEADTALAVLTKERQVIARAIVNRRTNVYGRIYTMNGSELNPLVKALQAAGYEEGEPLNDAKIRALQNDQDEWLCPYLDGESSGDLVHDAGRAYWRIGDGYYDLQNASGLAQETEDEDEECYRCDDCGHESSDEDEFHYSSYHDTRICDDCIDNYEYAYISRREKDWIHREGPIYERNGTWYHEDAFHWFDLVLCADDRLAKCDDAIEATDGEVFADAEHAKESDYVFVDGAWYYVDDTVETFDGEQHARELCTQLFDDSWAHDELHEIVEAENGRVAYRMDGLFPYFSHTLVRDLVREVCFVVELPYVLGEHEIYVETPDDLERTLEDEPALEAA